MAMGMGLECSMKDQKTIKDIPIILPKDLQGIERTGKLPILWNFDKNAIVGWGYVDKNKDGSFVVNGDVTDETNRVLLLGGCEFSLSYYKDENFYEIKSLSIIPIKALYHDDDPVILPLTPKAPELDLRDLGNKSGILNGIIDHATNIRDLFLDESREDEIIKHFVFFEKIGAESEVMNLINNEFKTIVRLRGELH